tara:strand:- start:234 stop:476 length:243 start_codon:yes stop_codon:yes gene_type:complete
MCLGGGGSSKPQLQQRTLPAEGTRPADESTKRTDKSEPKTIEFGDPNKTNPKFYEDTYLGTMTNIHRQAKASTKDPGINL